jgi:hypothetical protein
MAASVAVEEVQGTFVGFLRRHNGYYAGDFGAAPASLDGRWDAGSRTGTSRTPASRWASDGDDAGVSPSR